MKTDTGKGHPPYGDNPTVNPEELLKDLGDQAAKLESNIRSDTADLEQNKKETSAVKALVDDIGRAVAQFEQNRKKIVDDADKAAAAAEKYEEEVLCRVGADKAKVTAIIADVDAQIRGLERDTEKLTHEHEQLAQELAGAKRESATRKANFESLKKLTDQLKAKYARILAWEDRIKGEQSPQVQYLLLVLAESELESSSSFETSDAVLTANEYHEQLVAASGELYEAQQAEAKAKTEADAKNAELAAKQKELDDLQKNRASVLEKRVREAFPSKAPASAFGRP